MKRLVAAAGAGLTAAVVAVSAHADDASYQNYLLGHGYISDDNADDSRASLHHQLHDTRSSIVPRHAVRPCLRITGSFSSAPHPPRR
jgi:hypothetical protein